MHDLYQWLSVGGNYAPPGDTWQSGDIFGRPNWRWEGVTVISWVEARDAAKHPTVHRIAPPQQRMTQPQMSMLSRSTQPSLPKSESVSRSVLSDSL